MFLRLLAAFILIPFIELVLLLRMADATGWLTTLAIVIVTGIVGSYLARKEGLGALARFRNAVGEGRMPGSEIVDGMMIAFAAALLLTPGLLTDGFGFALLTPPGRRVIGGWLKKRYGGRFQVHVSGMGQSPETASGERQSRPTTGYTVDSPSYGPKTSG